MRFFRPCLFTCYQAGNVIGKIQFGDFFAYLNSGDNIHLFFPPFQVFNYSAPWVGTFWLEEVVYIYLFGLLGLIKLVSKGKKGRGKTKYQTMAWFTGVFLFSIFFVSHRDVARYALPVFPFVLLVIMSSITRVCVEHLKLRLKIKPSQARKIAFAFASSPPQLMNNSVSGNFVRTYSYI